MLADPRGSEHEVFWTCGWYPAGGLHTVARLLHSASRGTVGSVCSAAHPCTSARRREPPRLNQGHLNGGALPAVAVAVAIRSLGGPVGPPLRPPADEERRDEVDDGGAREIEEDGNDAEYHDDYYGYSDAGAHFGERSEVVGHGHGLLPLVCVVCLVWFGGWSRGSLCDFYFYVP